MSPENKFDVYGLQYPQRFLGGDHLDISHLSLLQNRLGLTSLHSFIIESWNNNKIPQLLLFVCLFDCYATVAKQSIHFIADSLGTAS